MCPDIRVINNADSARAVAVGVSGLKLGGVVNAEQSTAAAYWQPLAAFAPSDAARFAVTLPPLSVTTLVAQTGN